MKRELPQEEITTGRLLPAIIRLAVPLILANLMQTAYNIVDTYWVGRLGEEAVAAISLAFPISIIIVGSLTAFWFRLGRWKQQPPDEETQIKEQIIEETVVDEGVAD